MQPPLTGDDWCAVSPESLPVEEAIGWVVLPQCGAVVQFVGTVRDHAEGRPGVASLEYEAYVEQAVPKMGAVVAEARLRWPELGRVALLHRVGRLDVTEASVVVAVSAPHRDVAFAAARFAIDRVKASVPIWKREEWAGGTSWGTGAVDIQSSPAVT